MRQRAKLFDDFTNGLDGLTIKQKKDAVANLKRLLSSKVSFIHYLRTTDCLSLGTSLYTQ